MRRLAFLLPLIPALLWLIAGCGADISSPSGSEPAKGQVTATDSPDQVDTLPDISPYSGSQNPFDHPHEPDRLVVRFADLADIAAFAVQFPDVVIGESFDGFTVLYAPYEDLEGVAEEMVDDGYCDTVEPSAVYYLGNEVVLGFFETDPLTELGLLADANWQDRTDLGYLHGWVTGEGVKIAILDSGLGRVDGGTGVGNGVGGKDFVDDDDDPSEEIGAAYGHGTLVADLAAQVAPGATIIPMRVMNPAGEVLALDVVDALQLAITMGVDVVNMSFGGHTSPSYVEQALAACDEARIVMVASAGNLGDFDDKHYPSNSPYVCAVAATDPRDKRADFSSFGMTIEIAAPGQGIVGLGPDGGQAIGVGTSFSAPMIAGAIACKREANAGARAEHLRSALTNSSVPLSGDDAYRSGLISGRVDFDAFLFMAY